MSNNKNIFKPGNKLSENFNQIWNKPFINRKDINNKNFEELKDVIAKKLKEFFSKDFDENNKILDEVMAKKD